MYLKNIFILPLLWFALKGNCLKGQNDTVNFHQDITPVWRLVPTKNRWMFLKLNTKTGEIHEVQYSMEYETRFDQFHSFGVMKGFELKGDEPVNRFNLVPTENIYTFLLIDQIYGDVWQVQWGQNRGKVKILSAIEKEINKVILELGTSRSDKEE